MLTVDFKGGVKTLLMGRLKLLYGEGQRLFRGGVKPILRGGKNYFKGGLKNVSPMYFHYVSVYVDVVSNENIALFWIQSLSVCRAITFLITELILFSLALPPVGSVSIIEPEAPGVLLRF